MKRFTNVKIVHYNMKTYIKNEFKTTGFYFFTYAAVRTNVHSSFREATTRL